MAEPSLIIICYVIKGFIEKRVNLLAIVIFRNLRAVIEPSCHRLTAQVSSVCYRSTHDEILFPESLYKKLNSSSLLYKIWCHFAPVMVKVLLRIPFLNFDFHLPLLYFQLQRRGNVEKLKITQNWR